MWGTTSQRVLIEQRLDGASGCSTPLMSDMLREGE
jgi:hypothetical protein